MDIIAALLSVLFQTGSDLETIVMRTRFFGKIEEPFDGICVRSLFSVWSWSLISKWQLPAKLQAIQQKPLGILRIYRIISPYFSSNEIWGKYWFVISFLGICNKIFIFFLKALPKSHGEFASNTPYVRKCNQ